MLGVLLFLAVAAVGVAVLPAFVRLDEGHALAGLFGEPERDRVIAARSARVVESAEEVVRLARFREALGRVAWNGVPMAIRRVSSRWSEWTFADGTRWLVRHARRPPKFRRRVIVASATDTEHGVAVDAYAPGNGAGEEVMEITDARCP